MSEKYGIQGPQKLEKGMTGNTRVSSLWKNGGKHLPFNFKKKGQPQRKIHTQVRAGFYKGQDLDGPSTTIFSKVGGVIGHAGHRQVGEWGGLRAEKREVLKQSLKT